MFYICRYCVFTWYGTIVKDFCYFESTKPKCEMNTGYIYTATTTLVLLFPCYLLFLFSFFFFYLIATLLTLITRFIIKADKFLYNA